MNEAAFKSICKLFEEHSVEYKVIDHPACRTSLESAAARAAAGAPAAIGAKAILVNMTFDQGRTEFGVLVLPGNMRIDSKAVKSAIQQLKRFRFASAEEMLLLCGVIPGCMPPFAAPIFPEVPALFIDNSLLSYEWLGFNAASLERSIVVRSQDYLRVARHTNILSFSSL
jgi:Ala-tRNA(Pro) deacylase